MAAPRTFHQPGWASLPIEEFQRLVAEQTSEDGWVIDGNYSAVQPIVWARADTVVWLDLPRRNRDAAGRLANRARGGDPAEIVERQS